jgi:hypothetical protein
MFAFVVQAANNPPATLEELEGIFSNVVTEAIAFGGVVLFLVLVFGGFQYLTAGTDPRKVESAQKTLTYAIFGITLLAIAYLLLVMISTFTGQTAILKFDISI